VLNKIYEAVSTEAKKNDKDIVELLEPLAKTPREHHSGEEEGTDTAAEKSGEESGRSSRNDQRPRRGGPPRSFGGRGGGRGRGRGRGGRFRGAYGGGGGGYAERPARVRPLAPNGERYPPASQKEVRS
jgi:hypothetical protein